jgi:hypothetical protein
MAASMELLKVTYDGFVNSLKEEYHAHAKTLTDWKARHEA